MKPDLASPSRETSVDDWVTPEEPFSTFDGPEWRIEHTADHGRPGDIVVSVIGLQYADGPALCEIIIDCPDTPIITPAEARKLANALIAAADSAEA